MSTINQLINNPRKGKPKPIKIAILGNKPQARAVVTKVYTKTPKKPNSALRKVCNVTVVGGRRTVAYICGEGHNLQEHSEILIKGGRRKDLPGCKHLVVRGTRDAAGVAKRMNKRSKVGTPKPK